MNPPESPYYTVAEVAAILKVSQKTIRRRVAEGVFTRVTIPGGRAVRIPRVEVDGLMPRARRGRRQYLY